MKAAPNRIAEFRSKQEPALPLFTTGDLCALEQRVKTDCYKAHRIEMRKVRRRCYAVLGFVGMVGFLVGLVVSAVVICLFPL